MVSSNDEREPLLPVATTSSSSNGNGASESVPSSKASSTFKSVYEQSKRVVTSGGVRTFTSYFLLLALGFAVGVGVTRGWERWQETKDGPLMVPPVWTLPPPTGLPRNDAFMSKGQNGAVASEDVMCSNMGLSILKDLNGTAVDAAITTTLCIGLLNAFSAGIGGGGFAVVRVPTPGDAKVTAIDFREMSPKASEKDMYGSKRAGRMAAQVGGLAIAVPGELRGLEEAYKLYGTIPWRDLVMPVAELAKGWRVSRELARRIRLFGSFMLDNPTWAAVYAPRGTLLVEGEWIQRRSFGKTLEKIANAGPGVFYEGEMAATIVDSIQKAGGIVSLEDLKEYEARVYPAIHQTYRNQTLYTTDAPSSGGILLGLLNILETYPSPGVNHNQSEVDTVHRLIEAMKFAFGARSEITDPKFAPNVTRFADFYSKEWAREARSRLDETKTHDLDYYGLKHDMPADHGTTHLSIVDKWGGAASITSTVNLIWGSHVMCPHTGVIFNDEQDDFSVPGAADAFGLLPSPYNYPAPGKRAMSSTSPTIISNSDGTLRAVLGGSGGSRIFPSIAQVILNLERGMDLSEAIEAERWHNQLSPAVTTLEVGPNGVNRGLLNALKERGHEVAVFDINLGAAEVQAVLVDDEGIWASSDSRKNGVAAAY